MRDNFNADFLYITTVFGDISGLTLLHKSIKTKLNLAQDKTETRNI